MLNSFTKALTMPHMNVLYRWTNLGCTQYSQSISPISPILVTSVLLPRDPNWPAIPMYPQKTYVQELDFILTLASSARSTAKHLPRPSTLLMLSQATSLYIPPDQSFHHSNSSRPSFSSLATMDTRTPFYGLVEM